MVTPNTGFMLVYWLPCERSADNYIYFQIHLILFLVIHAGGKSKKVTVFFFKIERLEL